MESLKLNFDIEMLSEKRNALKKNNGHDESYKI